MAQRTRFGFAVKIASMPILASGVFVLLLGLARLTSLDNEKLMSRIETQAVPALELSRELEQDLENVQRAFQDAVIAEDADRLEEADRLRQRVLSLLEAATATIPAQQVEIGSLARDFAAYHALAHGVSLRMIRGEAGVALEGATEQMSLGHRRLRDAIRGFTHQTRWQVATTFAEARANHVRALRASSMIILAGLLVLTALSLFVVRSTVRPLSRAVAAAEALARGDLSADVTPHSRDEVGRLLLSMQRMMTYLREMAEAADRIAAGDLSRGVEPLSPQDRFGNAFARMSDSLEQMVSVAARIAAGDLDRRVQPRSSDDRFSPALNAMVDSLAGANVAMAKAARLKDEFLANMSHELRTPLNAVLGMSEALLEEVYGPLNQRQKGSLATIHASGGHLLSVINDILDLSKIEAGKLELEVGTVRVESLCQDSLQFVADAAQKKQLRLALAVDPRVRTIRADERRLRQILINLLSNAVKFTSEGEVGVEVTPELPEGSLRFTVWDTGIGISKGDQVRLFQPFSQIDSRLSREYCGTGLGLALVRRMVEMHGGSVSVESQPGKGSRFTVILPWQQNEELVDAGSRGKPAPAASAAVGGPLILLAEDNEANVATVTEYLKAKGFRISVARDGLEAVARAEDSEPDVVLMDIHMPRMDGLEAIRRIRAAEHERRVPIIALTSLAMSGDRERCLRAGADDHMTKPLSLKALVAAIEALSRRRNKEESIWAAAAV